MIHHFPLFTAAHTLSRHDFRNFLFPFSKLIKEKIITAAEVYFLENAEQLEGLLIDDVSGTSILKEMFIATTQIRAPAGHGHCLFFPFFTHDQQIVVALVTGLNPLFVKKAGHDWLQETRDVLQQEFLILKQAGVDLQTGLLNGAHLSTLFDTCPEGEDIGLVLVELYPKVRTAMEDMQHVRRSAAILKSFTGERAPLYHIGQSVFAYPCRNCTEDSAAKFGPLLVSFLKREQFKRVHVGYSQGKIGTDHDYDQDQIATNGRQILDEAWLALQTACKRGPFSFCTYRSLQNSQRHCLYASDKDIQARLRPHWQQLEQFALVQLHPTKSLENLSSKITLKIPGSKKIKGKDNDIFLLLPTSDLQKVLSLTKDVIQSIAGQGNVKESIAAGIALFPFHGFKKTETVLNCRKALLHGELQGQDMITFFEALSLNVSGDIFYGEGDIPRAIREYRRGLLIAPHDVNLLNSLGVGYAMMNRHREAVACFLKALAIKQDHFISWYNLGLERKLQNDIAGAVESFEHALQCHMEDEQDTTSTRKELPLQLGKLYSQTGRYKDAIHVLLPWYNTESSNPGSGRALRYLGESFHGIGRDREAMSWLQRAIRFDEFDAEALSLLGEIYLYNNEGDQIALKLCEKSVELNQTQPLFYLRLASAQIQCGHLEAARVNLRFCLKNKKTRGAAEFQMGLIYWKQGQLTRARHWFTRTLDHEPPDTRWHTLAGGYLNQM